MSPTTLLYRHIRQGESALKEGLGVWFLPCFLGDGDPELVSFHEPQQEHEHEHELGLWLLYHRDLRNTKRVALFREHMQNQIKQATGLFEGVKCRSSDLD